MNYFILKNIIDMTIANFVCQNCGGKVGERDVSLLGTTAAGVNMEIRCPHCQANGVVKAEVNFMSNSLQSGTIDPEAVRTIKNIIENTAKERTENRIKDADIVSLRESLRQGAVSAEDLFQ
jgi:DNA-directed RNA polymerase subunit RPC12/RpoP